MEADYEDQAEVSLDHEEEEEDGSINPDRCERIGECCTSFGRGMRKVISFLLSHLGLMTIVVAYCLIGGVVFERIEKDHEIKVKDSIQVMRQDVTNDIWTMTNEARMLKEEDWMVSVDDRMRQFELDLINTMRKKGWNGYESHDKTQWTFTGSLFYSIICITTIGYGDQTPKTPTGKLVTIFYAVLGIPLMLFFLTNTGYAMAQSFRFVYWRICCFICINTKPPPIAASKVRRRRGRTSATRSPHRSLSVRSAASSIGVSNSFSSRKSMKRGRRATVWNLSENPKSLTEPPSPVSKEPPSMTNGITLDINPDQDAGLEMKCDQTPTTGITRQGSEKRGSKRVRRPQALNIPKTQRNLSGDSSSPSSPGQPVFKHQRSTGGSFRSTKTVDDEEGIEYPIDDEYFEEAIRKRDIPLWICGFLVLSYILGGAYLFSKWEKWKFLDAAYFCFVTLTTIGFGDFVPKTEQKVNAKISILICSLYLLFGMSLLVMTFNLVQQRVVNKIRKIGQRLGFIKSDDVYDME